MKKFFWKHLFASLCLSLFFGSISAQQSIVMESTIARQTEDDPPAASWVGYFRTGTPMSALQFTNGPGAPPAGCGSVQLTTLTGAEKVQLFNFDHVGKTMAAITAISYSTYRVTPSPSTPSSVVSLNVLIDPDGPGGPATFSTLVFEPVYNTDQGILANGIWQTWNAKAGKWWSTKNINGQPSGAIIANLRTWAQIVANNPNATILGGVGLNQGSGNAGLVSAADAFVFDTDTYNFEQVANPVSNTNTGRTYCNIQSAINDPLTLSGHTIQVGAGTYNENVSLTKSITLQGAGNTTILSPSTSCSGNGITISANNAIVKNMKITDYTYGVVVAASGIDLNNIESVANCVAGIELGNGINGLTVENSKINNNVSVGLRAGTGAQMSNITIDNCEVKGNKQGMFIAATSGPGNSFDQVSIKNSDFSNNTQKGMYFEKLSNAVIENIIMNNSAFDASYNNNNGIDINLKYGSYSNITIKNSSITNCGANGNAIDPEAASAIAIKARDDAPSYNGNPASLNGVYVLNNLISGSQNGIRIGEYGKTNNTPTGVWINNNDLSASFANKALINRTPATTNATCNWYGTVDGSAIGAKISGSITYEPWLTNGTDNDVANGFQPVAGSCNGTSTDYDGDGILNGNDCAPLDPEVGAADMLLFRDADGDGYGDANNSMVSCGPVAGYVDNNYDCDDNKKAKNPQDEMVIMCRSTDNKSECVKWKDVQKKMNDGFVQGPCTSPCGTEYTLMCDKGKMKCVKNKDVQRNLGKGWTLGACQTITFSSRQSLEAPIALTENKISIYPSPTKGQVTVRVPALKSGKAEIVILNSNGSVVERRSIKSSAGTIEKFDLRRNGPGMYFIKIVSAGGVQTNKIIVQR